MLSTDDGGITWKELPDPPSAGDFRFHTPQDGWMVIDPNDDGLSVTHDGGRTWEEKKIPPPANCSQCAQFFTAPPHFKDPRDGVMTVEYEANSSNDPTVSSTYVTHDGGNSWQLTEAIEQTGSDQEMTTTFNVDMHAIRVLLDPVEVRTPAGITKPLIFPKQLSPRGGMAQADFVDDSNGWFVYGSPSKCIKLRNRATDGPGLPCMAVGSQSDLLTTKDGGRTFRVITPKVSSVSSQ